MMPLPFWPLLPWSLPEALLSKLKLPALPSMVVLIMLDDPHGWLAAAAGACYEHGNDGGHNSDGGTAPGPAGSCLLLEPKLC